MSTRPDHERSISGWLVAQASDRAPDRVLEASRERIRTTRQRQAWWPAWRIPEMNKFVAVGLAAAAVVVVAFVGIQLIGGTNPGGPAPSPVESSTPGPTPVVNADFTTHPGGGAELLPGSYVIDYPAPVNAVITIPAEPFDDHPTAWYKALNDWGPHHQTNAARLGFVLVENLYVDPCDADLALLDPAVGPTVDDLAAALSSVPRLTVSSSSAVTLDGYRGQLMELTGGEPPPDCIEDRLVFETTRGEAAFLQPTTGDRTRLWILDVAGNRLVIWASEDCCGPDAAAFEDSLQALVDSIQIEAP